jgi:hypothetical protein
MEDVTHVFHVAATVRFDENLRLAVGINIMGTHNVLELAKEMAKLKVSSGVMPFSKLHLALLHLQFLCDKTDNFVLYVRFLRL